MVKQPLEGGCRKRGKVAKEGIQLPRSKSRVWVYSLRSLKNKTATAINVIRQIGFSRRKRRGIKPNHD